MQEAVAVGLYSLKCLEVVFCELRLYRILRSSHVRRFIGSSLAAGQKVLLGNS